MKAYKILFAIATTLVTACSSGQKDDMAGGDAQLDTSVTDSVTVPESGTAPTRTGSLSGSSGNGTLTDTANVNTQGATKTAEAGASPRKTKSLSGSSGTGTIADTTDVNRQKTPR